MRTSSGCWTKRSATCSFVSRRAPSTTNRGVWALCLAQASALKRDESNVRKYAEIARAEFEKRLEAVPEDAQDPRSSSASRSRTWEGRPKRSARPSERWSSLPISRDAHFGPYVQHQLVRVLHASLARTRRRSTMLEPLLKMPYAPHAGWLEDQLPNSTRSARLRDSRV